MKTSIPLEFIELEKQSFHLIVNAKVNDLDIRMVLDTGASRSCFDLNFLLNSTMASSVHNTEIKSSGLGGDISESSLVLLNTFEIGEFRIIDFKAVSLNLNAVNQAYESANISPVNGILGGDILYLFRATIRYDKSLLVLKTRKPDAFNIKF